MVKEASSILGPSFGRHGPRSCSVGSESIENDSLAQMRYDALSLPSRSSLVMFEQLTYADYLLQSPFNLFVYSSLRQNERFYCADRTTGRDRLALYKDCVCILFSLFV